MNARIAVRPEAPPWLVDALTPAGVDLVEDPADAEGLIWLGFHDPVGLAAALESFSALRWVQLPSAGVDDFAGAGVLDPRLEWTSAKGAYAEPVAEHALTLILALLRHLPERARAAAWGTPAGRSLYGKRVLVVGAGGVAQELIRLLVPFHCHITVVRRQPFPVITADETHGPDELAADLTAVDVVVLAAAMTADTRALIGAPELAAMKPDSVLVNIARGGLVDLDAIAALPAGTGPAGIGLDVTDPEPLPDDSPLWMDPRVLTTPHTADTWKMIRPLLTARIVDNVTGSRPAPSSPVG